MTEEDQFTKDKELINTIRQGLREEFDIESEYVGDSRIGISEFDGYINSDEHYEDIEGLAESLCDWLRIRFDNDFTYELLSEGYEFIISVI